MECAEAAGELLEGAEAAGEPLECAKAAGKPLECAEAAGEPLEDGDAVGLPLEVGGMSLGGGQDASVSEPLLVEEEEVSMASPEGKQ